MQHWQNRVAIVTGASSGIGQAIAKDLAIAGLLVVTVARRFELLQENRSKLPQNVQSHVYPRKCDIANEAEVKDTFKWIKDNLGGVDILVNNAGIVRFGNLLQMDTSVIGDVINTNVNGLIYCTQAAFKSMKERKFDGHIVHINSILGHNVFQKMPNCSFNIYPSTKFAVTAINETIRNELRDLGTKIRTTSISPGLVRTEISSPEAYERANAVLEPEDISQAVLFAISMPPHVQIHEIIVHPVGKKY